MDINKFIEEIKEKLSVDIAKNIFQKINDQTLTWSDLKEINKVDINIPEEVELIADEHIDFSDIPELDDYLLNKKTEIYKTNIWLTEDNYKFIQALDSNKALSTHINEIIEMYKEFYKKAEEDIQNIGILKKMKSSKQKRKEKV